MYLPLKGPEAHKMGFHLSSFDKLVRSYTVSLQGIPFTTQHVHQDTLRSAICSVYACIIEPRGGPLMLTKLTVTKATVDDN